jgi:uncharacterized membrane protein YfcA
MSMSEAALLVAGGLAAGTVNTLAGAGSLLTVPLLVLLGLPGNVANGTNRIGILVHNGVAAWRFRAEGVSGFRRALPLVLPVSIGSFVGAYAISQVGDKTFEKLFGLVMVLLLLPLLRMRGGAAAPEAPAPWSAPVSFLVFLGIGLFGGAFQAGVGLALIFALSHAGHDLVRANSVKVVVNLALTAMAVPVFLLRQQVAWLPAVLLACGFALGAAFGVRLAVHGGDRVIRPVLIVSVIALAGRMLGLY